MASRARVLAVGGGAVGVIAVVAVVALSGGAGDEPAGASQSTATTTISRQDLVETEDVDGSLGYSDARTVVNRLAGTVTWTPRVGSVVHTNHRLYEIDGSAVYLLDGAYPAYRTLQAGLSGGDVRELERNLRRLGLDPDGEMSVDGTWDAGTTAAVKRWQARKGLTQTGSIAKGRIVFQPGSRRVGDIKLTVGSNASGGGGGAGASASPASYGAGEAATLLLASASGKPPAASGFSELPVAYTARSAQAPAATTTPAPAEDPAPDTPAPAVPAPTKTTPAPTKTTPAPTTTAPPPSKTTPAPTTTAPSSSKPSGGKNCSCETDDDKPASKGGATSSSGGSAGGRSGSSGARGGAASAAATRGGATGGSAGGGSGGGSSSASGAAADVDAALMSTTSTKRIVTVDLVTTKQSLAKQGSDVSVELPDGRHVPGTIARVGKVAQKKATSQDDDPPATIKLIIKLKKSTGTGLDQAPVDVKLERQRAKDVLTVPVTALLAREGGKFAVELRDGAKRRLVAVRTGLFTDSFVEIEGEGLRSGQTVTNAAI